MVSTTYASVVTSVHLCSLFIESGELLAFLAVCVFMGARRHRHGGGGHLPPLEMLESVLCISSYSQTLSFSQLFGGSEWLI